MTQRTESLHRLIEHNCQLLDELCQVVAVQTDSVLFFADKNHANNSIANHIRHICEHYSCLFSGLRDVQKTADSHDPLTPTNPYNIVINYDDRPRNSEAFSSINAVSHAIVQIISCLRQLTAQTPFTEFEFSVLCSTSSDFPAIACPSNLLRELQFLHGHTVHHLALIALLLHQAGIEMPRTFGTAASTLKYEKQN